MDWSTILKLIRENLCISQTELAQLLGVSFVSVNRWENGHFEPTLKVKRKILRFCRDNGIKIEDYDYLPKH